MPTQATPRPKEHRRKQMTSAVPKVSSGTRKQLRSCPAMFAYSTVFEDKSMQDKQKFAIANDLYFGTTTKASQMQLFLAGQGAYAVLFEPLVVTDNSGDEVALKLQEQFCGHESTRPVRLGKEISKDVMANATFKSKSPMDPRAIWKLGANAMAGYRKILAVLEPKLDQHGQPKESGKRIHDVWKEVLDEMWKNRPRKAPPTAAAAVDLTEAETQDTADVETQDAPAGPPAQAPGDEDTQIQDTQTQESAPAAIPDSSERPPGWYPDGYFAAHCFGPTAKENFRITVTHTKDPPVVPGTNKKERGRAAHRKKQKEEKDTLREHDASGNRGMTTNQRLHEATLRMKIEELEQNRKQDQIVANSLVASQLSFQIQVLEREIATRYKEPGTPGLKEMEENLALVRKRHLEVTMLMLQQAQSPKSVVPIPGLQDAIGYQTPRKKSKMSEGSSDREQSDEKSAASEESKDPYVDVYAFDKKNFQFSIHKFIHSKGGRFIPIRDIKKEFEEDKELNDILGALEALVEEGKIEADQQYFDADLSVEEETHYKSIQEPSND